MATPPESRVWSLARVILFMGMAGLLIGFSFSRIHTYALVSDPAFYLLKARGLLNHEALATLFVAPTFPLFLAGLMKISVPLAYAANLFVFSGLLLLMYRTGLRVKGSPENATWGVLVVLSLIWTVYPESPAFILYPFREPLGAFCIWAGILVLQRSNDQNAGPTLGSALVAGGWMILAVSIRENLTVMLLAAGLWLALQRAWKPLIAFSLLPLLAGALYIFAGHPSQARVYGIALAEKFAQLFQSGSEARHLLSQSLQMYLHPPLVIAGILALACLRHRRNPAVFILAWGGLLMLLELGLVRAHPRYVAATLLFLAPLGGWGAGVVLEWLRKKRGGQAIHPAWSFLPFFILLPAFFAARNLVPWGVPVNGAEVQALKKTTRELPSLPAVIEESNRSLQSVAGIFQFWPPHRHETLRTGNFYYLAPLNEDCFDPKALGQSTLRGDTFRDRFDLAGLPGAPSLALGNGSWKMLLAKPFSTRALQLPVTPDCALIFVNLAQSRHPTLSYSWSTQDGMSTEAQSTAAGPGWMGFVPPPGAIALNLASDLPLPAQPTVRCSGPQEPARFFLDAARIPADHRLLSEPSGSSSAPFAMEFVKEARIILPPIHGLSGQQLRVGFLFTNKASKQPAPAFALERDGEAYPLAVSKWSGTRANWLTYLLEGEIPAREDAEGMPVQLIRQNQQTHDVRLIGLELSVAPDPRP